MKSSNSLPRYYASIDKLMLVAICDPVKSWEVKALLDELALLGISYRAKVGDNPQVVVKAHKAGPLDKHYPYISVTLNGHRFGRENLEPKTGL